MSTNAYDSSTTVRNQLDKLGVYAQLNKKGVTEVWINRPYSIFTEGDDGRECIESKECSYESLLQLCKALAIFNGKNLNENSPIQSITFPDGERGQVIMPPACETGTISLTVRKPSKTRFTIEDYVNSGRLSGFSDASENLTIPEGVRLKPWEIEMMDAKANQDMGKFFRLAIQHKLNIVFVGGTGSGKTTITKAVADLIESDTRIITIEDTHELDLPKHANHVHLFYGDVVTPKDSIASCMRMKPDRILLTELRGDEAWDYITMLNTGHPGSLTTVHANDCIGAYARVATLVKQSGVGQTLDYSYILNVVKSTLDVICFFEKTKLKEIYYDPITKFNLLAGR